MTVIECKNLCKNFRTKIKQQGLSGSFRALFQPDYKNVTAVNNISFNVNRGEILAFIGPNGAGKSTTIKMLTGILFPTSGNIDVLGFNPTKQRGNLAYRIGSVFGQKSQMWFHLPPLDSFQLLGAIYEIPKKELKKRIEMLTELFEIKNFLLVPVRKLSLGQRMRCELASSILHNPEIIFLDEPTIGLDVVVKQKIRSLIIRLNQEEKTTIFLTSHDVGDIEKICRRAVIIHHGRIVLDENIKKLKYNYLNKKVISIKYTDKVNLDIPSVKLLKQKDYSMKIEVDTKKTDLHHIMELLIKKSNVSDITISDQPMEDIIVTIYQTKKQESTC